MIKFNKQVQEQFDKMCSTGKLFRVAMTGHEVWDLYLKSFPEGKDLVFRDPASSEHNCNHCNNFIKRYGNVVAISGDNTLMTLFDFEADEEFAEVAKALSVSIGKFPVIEVFFETFNELNNLPYEKCSNKNDVFRLGIDKNVKRYTQEEADKFGVVKANELRTFNHMHLDLPKIFVDTTGNSVESIMGNYRDAKNVFRRAMEEISLDTYLLVKDLIVQDSLLDGATHLHKIEQMIPLKKQYDELSKKERDNWCWVMSYRLPFAKFRNELIGVLCSELSSGEEINKACTSWNKRVDPVNYMKASAPITKKQIEEAKAFVEENGYSNSFDRRMATIDDINASEIRHINVEDGKLKTISVFDSVQPTKVSQHKRNEFDGIEEVGIEKFLADILPSCTAVEAFVQNDHEGNFVSLTTSNIPESKPIFKWPNNYSWTFNGNLAGKSQIKEAVSAKGGIIDGVLRFSIMWAEGDATDNSDLDAWAREPNGTSIGYNAGYRKDNGNRRTPMSGQLDVDITNPHSYHNKNIVENIVWTDLSKMKEGTYSFWVNQFSNRGSKGFRAEIEFNGELYSYEYARPVNGNVQVAQVTLKDGYFSIVHALPETTVSSKECYGIATNHFHKINLVCLSPNHWGESKIGNKYYLFMLHKCKAPHVIRGFHNENLIPELLAHRKVMEVLGTTSSVPSTDKQLSGIGFNATVRDELIVKLSGNFKRTIKIKF